MVGMSTLRVAQNFDRFRRLAEANIKRSKVGPGVRWQLLVLLEPLLQLLGILLIFDAQRAGVLARHGPDRDVTQRTLVEQESAPLRWERRIALAGVIKTCPRIRRQDQQGDDY